MKSKTNIKMLRFFLASILFTFMPMTLLADVVTNNVPLKVGDYKALCTPKSPFDGYPSLSALTRWWWDGPIEVTSDRRPAAIVIKATGTGTATVICDAYFWNTNWVNSTRGYRDLTIRWNITIEEGDIVPSPTTPAQDSYDFIAGDVITRSVDGVDMKFSVGSSSDYAAMGNFGPAYVYASRIPGYTDEIAIPVTTSGKLSIPEVVPNTSGCVIKWIYNPNGSYDISPKLEALRVEQVMSSAFYGCDKLTSVEIPATVKSIGYQAFYGCTSLEEVTVQTANPPSIGKQAFSEEVLQKAILWVPEGAKEAYSNSSWNNYFENIKEVGEGELFKSLKDGDTFTAYTEEGVEMTFKVVSAAERTCQVGVGSYVQWDGGKPMPAIDQTISGQITIPAVAMGFKVIGIGGTAFWHCNEITKVVMPDNVNYIEEQSFYGCSKLSAITLPEKMDHIGYEAFCDCKNLSKIVIPEGVKELCATFNGCTSLSEVQLPSTLTQLVGGGSDWLQSIGVFQNCKRLTSIELPQSLTSIGEASFSGCESLVSVNIPEGVTTIGGAAFYGCSSLENVTLPSKLTAIESYILFFPVGAFEGSGIKSVTIPAAVTQIGPKAFANCPNLGSVMVDRQNAVYDSREDCNAIIFTKSDSLVSGCRSTVIPGTIKKLGAFSFNGVTGLTQIKIPKSVVSVGGNPFSSPLLYEGSDEELLIPAIVGCKDLESITVEEGNPVYDSREGCNAIIETATNKLVIGTSKTTVPKSVDKLGICSITNGESAEFTIPANIKFLEPSVFGDAFIFKSHITDVSFEEGTKKIPTKALYGNSGIEELTIPSTLTHIGDSAFVGCNNLEVVICHVKNPYVMDYSNIDRYNLLFDADVHQKATLFVPRGSKELYEQRMIGDNYNYWSFFQNIVEMINGDVNGDGIVDVADIATIISVMSGSQSGSSRIADVNGDGVVDVADISAVITIMAGDSDDEFHVSPTEWNKTSKVEYRYLDASTPPDYHRSYTISISEKTKEISIDSYRNILLSRQYTNTTESFLAFKDALARKGIYKHAEIIDYGCSGGTSEYLRLYDGNNCYFDGYVYHCAGESGDLYLPASTADLFEEQIPENVADLINSTR